MIVNERIESDKQWWLAGRQPNSRGWSKCHRQRVMKLWVRQKGKIVSCARRFEDPAKSSWVVFVCFYCWCLFIYYLCCTYLCQSHSKCVLYGIPHEKKRYQIKLNALDANESNNMLLPYGVCESVHTPFTHKHKRFHIFPSSSFALFGPIHTLPRTAEGRIDHIYLYMRFERNKKYL